MNSSELFYVKPVFDRGSGLGNRLFPWARCLLFAKRHGARVLSPCWAHFRTAPLRKGGTSLRHYPSQILLAGVFKAAPDYVRAPKKYFVEWSALQVSETVEPASLEKTGRKNVIFTFRGCGNFFEDLKGNEELIFKELLTITRPRWLRLADSFGDIPIALNIRRGKDFADSSDPEDFYKKGALRTPLKWFEEALRFVRLKAGKEVRAYVISDGSARDLAPILNLPNVVFVRPGCAISDLLVMSRAKLLIASGGSSFGAWASFLGGMTTITIPGQSYSWYKLYSDDKRYVGDFDPAAPDTAFLGALSRIIRDPVFAE